MGGGSMAYMWGGVHMCMCTYMCHGHVWRSEGNMQEFVLFFYREGPRKGTRVVRLCNKSFIHGALSLSPGHFKCLRPWLLLMYIRDVHINKSCLVFLWVIWVLAQGSQLNVL